jgi:hypothetical protein
VLLSVELLPGRAEPLGCCWHHGQRNEHVCQSQREALLLLTLLLLLLVVML